MKARVACRVVALLACLAAASAVSFSAATKFNAGSVADESLEVRLFELQLRHHPLPPAPCPRALRPAPPRPAPCA